MSAHATARPASIARARPARRRLRAAAHRGVSASALPARRVVRTPRSPRASASTTTGSSRTGVHSRRHAAPASASRPRRRGPAPRARPRRRRAPTTSTSSSSRRFTQDDLRPTPRRSSPRARRRRAPARRRRRRLHRLPRRAATWRRRRSSPAAPTTCSSSAPRSSRASLDPTTAAPPRCSATAPARPCSAPTARAAIGPILLGADGAPAPSITCAERGPLIRMDGHETFKFAVTRLREVDRSGASRAAGLALDDIDLFVYHQANGAHPPRRRRAPGPRPRSVVDAIGELGNTSAALDPARAGAAARGRPAAPGRPVLLAAFGAGFTWGARSSTGGAHERRREAPRAGHRRLARHRRRDRPGAGRRRLAGRLNYRSDGEGAERIVEAIEARRRPRRRAQRRRRRPRGGRPMFDARRGALGARARARQQRGRHAPTASRRDRRRRLGHASSTPTCPPRSA